MNFCSYVSKSTTNNMKKALNFSEEIDKDKLESL